MITSSSLFTGAFMFASDLLKSVQPVPDGLHVDFMRASSYGAGTSSTGTVELGVRHLN
jgi:hypoxanthine phosphoribosyltransferase